MYRSLLLALVLLFFFVLLLFFKIFLGYLEQNFPKQLPFIRSELNPEGHRVSVDIIEVVKTYNTTVPPKRRLRYLLVTFNSAFLFWLTTRSRFIKKDKKCIFWRKSREVRQPVALYRTFYQCFESALVSMRIRIQGFDDQELKKYLGTNCNLLSYPWALHRGRPSYRRSLQLSKENIIILKHEISSLFIFLCVIFALLNPDTNSQCVSGFSRPKSMRIRIRNTALYRS